MSGTVISVLASILVLQFIIVGYAASPGEIDATAIVASVHDGDTFHVDREFFGSDTVRLADIDASKLGQPLSYEARDFLSQLVYDKTVYLDIDDLYTFDYRGTGHRLVCVVYVSHNLTHYKNANLALLDAGLAEEIDYDNEFDPDTWALYVSKQVIPEFQPILVLPLLMAGTLLAAIFTNRRRERLNRATCAR